MSVIQKLFKQIDSPFTEIWPIKVLPNGITLKLGGSFLFYPRIGELSMETKICIKCGIKKEINNFRKSGKYIRGECKECVKKHNKVYKKAYYINNKEKIDKKSNEFRKKQ